MDTWIPATTPPALDVLDLGWPQSRPVLGYLGNGDMRVVTFEDRSDEDVADFAWYTFDGERWEVTGRVTHWMPLPEVPNV